MTVPTDRTTFRATVAAVAEKAKARLPQAVNGRIEAAARLVINGDVEPLNDGSVKVGGSDPTRWYHLVGPTCTCTDFVQGRAPSGWCKHRIAAGIHKRVQELLPQAPEPEDIRVNPNNSPLPEDITVNSKNSPLPEAPASVNVRLTIAGREVQWTLRDQDEARLARRLEALLARYPVPQPAPQAASQGEGWCAVHQVQMKRTTKDGRSWWSHKTQDGWCKGAQR
jgi:hypothetical protein